MEGREGKERGKEEHGCCSRSAPGLKAVHRMFPLLSLVFGVGALFTADVLDADAGILLSPPFGSLSSYCIYLSAFGQVSVHCLNGIDLQCDKYNNCDAITFASPGIIALVFFICLLRFNPHSKMCFY